MTKQKKYLTKKQRQRLTFLGYLLICVVGGILIGVIMMKTAQNRTSPKNLVWAADNTVKVPKDLAAFLARQDGCQHYRGTGSPNGVGLWGVYQVSQSRFAKIAYGCSWSLSPYVMAVKENNQWRLIPSREYFAPFKEGIDPQQGALPNCSIIEKYNIPKEIESFCISTEGNAKSNEL